MLGVLRGGAGLELLAAQGDDTAFLFPVPMQKTRSCDFSFAGLKEAVRRKVLEMCGGDDSLGWEETAAIMQLEENRTVRADIAASFQAAVCKHLVTRTERAIMFAAQDYADAADAYAADAECVDADVGAGADSSVSSSSLSLSPPPPLPLGLVSLFGGVACNNAPASCNSN